MRHPGNTPADPERLRKLGEENREQLVGLVESMLVMDPAQRMSAPAALSHSFFAEPWHLSAPERLYFDVVGEHGMRRLER